MIAVVGLASIFLALGGAAALTVNGVRVARDRAAPRVLLDGSDADVAERVVGERRAAVTEAALALGALLGSILPPLRYALRRAGGHHSCR